MKILLVVGTLFPYDRLVKEIDQWASDKENIEVFGQIGFGKYTPGHMEYNSMLKASDFNQRFDESDLVITHAGMGIVLKSLVAKKPIVVLPRKLELNEHTTDHQMATAKALDKMKYVHVAWNNEELREYLNHPEEIASKKSIGEYAEGPLVESIQDFIRNN